MNIATCAINDVSNSKRYDSLKLVTLRRVSQACVSILLLLSVLFTSFPLRAASNVSEELVQERNDSATKMVLGIISYARWPEPLPVIRLCVVAPTDYAQELFNPALMQTSHPIKTQSYSLSDVSIATHCDVVYLGHVDIQQRQELATQLSGHSVLTISEDYDECTFGSAFCLLLEDKQASFKVNMDALARAGVRVHPSVLQLARKKAGAL
ncbi:YfiR family protein [Yersinia pekkanenii]|uniref:Protein YfiR n=1 Tax=Yersinia pekkanenii TaxID=1288385 RepID=A0A0T9NUN3_9GAMM|nr:YfiR family protein [Yersinia pekkanenii]CNH31038.1 protein YfiR [Yersinia pekkanenii]CRY63094.1 protein YfiR [Yersinia pekkanenii]